jgi:beta-fructofuranosidase
MSLRLPDKWVWDFWLVRDGSDHHIFYLQAPRTLERPSLRHHNASIGHAVSRDLRSWDVLPDALHPGPEGSWDDLATWTGSAIDHDGRWHMLYTGISRREQGLVQRIGLAVSDDLVRWEKHPANPVLQADARWYDLLDPNRWRDQSWRDPWLFRDPDDAYFHCLITARSRTGARDSAGVVGHARSRDLVAWEVLPPLTSPGEFAQVEAPQLVRMNGRYEILVSCLAEDHSQARIERLGISGQTGTFVFSADRLSGPYSSAPDPIADPGGPLGTLYAGKLLEDEDGTWRFMAFRGDGDRDFLGELTDPLPLRYDGQLPIVVSYPQVPAETAP